MNTDTRTSSVGLGSTFLLVSKHLVTLHFQAVLHRLVAVHRSVVVQSYQRVLFLVSSATQLPDLVLLQDLQHLPLDYHCQMDLHHFFYHHYYRHQGNYQQHYQRLPLRSWGRHQRTNIHLGHCQVFRRVVAKAMHEEMEYHLVTTSILDQHHLHFHQLRLLHFHQLRLLHQRLHLQHQHRQY